MAGDLRGGSGGDAYALACCRVFEGEEEEEEEAEETEASAGLSLGQEGGWG